MPNGKSKVGGGVFCAPKISVHFYIRKLI